MLGLFLMRNFLWGKQWWQAGSSLPHRRYGDGRGTVGSWGVSSAALQCSRISVGFLWSSCGGAQCLFNSRAPSPAETIGLSGWSPLPRSMLGTASQPEPQPWAAMCRTFPGRAPAAPCLGAWEDWSSTGGVQPCPWKGTVSAASRVTLPVGSRFYAFSTPSSLATRAVSQPLPGTASPVPSAPAQQFSVIKRKGLLFLLC